MTNGVSLVGLLLLASALAEAQSLGEVAKKERERRRRTEAGPAAVLGDLYRVKEIRANRYNWELLLPERGTSEPQPE